MRDWAAPPEPLPHPVVDNHTHLDMDGTDVTARTPSARLDEAAAVGVTRAVQIGCDLDGAEWTAQAILADSRLVGGVALHPNEAPLHVDGTHPSGLDYEHAFARIAQLARGERMRAVGETGLDYFRSEPPAHAAQQRSFRDHIALAKELGLVLQIHDRDAHADVLDILARDGAPERTVFHCFSGDAAMARECVERGYFLSFAGTVTFTNASGLREALAATPLDRLLVETDAPFLTPHPQRGRVNSPAQVAATTRVMADVLDVDLERLCRALDATSESLYGPW